MEVAVFCNSCQFGVISDAERTSHYKSQWHRYNVKRKVKGLPCVSLELFQKKLELLSGNTKKDSDEEGKDENGLRSSTAEIAKKEKSIHLKCRLCGNDFKTQNALDNHLASKKHRKALELADISARKLNDPSYLADPIVRIETTKESQTMQVESEFDPENYDLSQAIPVGSCLFCPKTNFESVEACLAHMSSDHGFFIPCTIF
jgi:pre-60S factor REI1